MSFICHVTNQTLTSGPSVLWQQMLKLLLCLNVCPALGVHTRQSGLKDLHDTGEPIIHHVSHTCQVQQAELQRFCRVCVCVRQEVCEERAQRSALRNNSVVPFFHSENVPFYQVCAVASIQSRFLSTSDGHVTHCCLSSRTFCRRQTPGASQWIPL